MNTRCEFPSENHSTDTVAVFHGSPVPTVLCGFHASWRLNTVLTTIRAHNSDNSEVN